MEKQICQYHQNQQIYSFLLIACSNFVFNCNPFVLDAASFVNDFNCIIMLNPPCHMYIYMKTSCLQHSVCYFNQSFFSIASALLLLNQLIQSAFFHNNLFFVYLFFSFNNAVFIDLFCMFTISF